MLEWIKKHIAANAEPAADEQPRMQISAIAAKVGMPEERVAQISQMIKTQGLADSQMGPMMRMATEKGVEPSEILAMLTSLGVSQGQVVRVLSSQGLITDDEAQRLIEEERKAAERRAAEQSQTGLRRFVRKAAIIMFWIVVWELLDRVIDNRLVLAGPIRTAQALVEQLGASDFWIICGASFGRIAVGFLLSFVVGFFLALLSCRFRLFRDFVEPLISLLRTIPVASFIILLLIWVGNQALTIYLSFLIVLPLIYTNTFAGLSSVDPNMLEMAQVFGLSPWKKFLYIYRPAFMPYVISGCRVSLGMSWKSGIMAEVVGTPKPSIGREMFAAKQYLKTADLFAWTVVVIILSILFEKIFLALIKLADRPMGGWIGKEGADEHTN